MGDNEKVLSGSFVIDLKTYSFEECAILADLKYNRVFMTGHNFDSMHAMLSWWPSLNWSVLECFRFRTTWVL